MKVIGFIVALLGVVLATGCGGDECGNGTLDADEECDGHEMGGSTCKSLGYHSGTLYCTATCSLDRSSCALCTDKIMNGNETDVDCGGGTCLKCSDGKKCNSGSDCRSTRCVAGWDTPQKCIPCTGEYTMCNSKCVKKLSCQNCGGCGKTCNKKYCCTEGYSSVYLCVSDVNSCFGSIGEMGFIKQCK